MPEGFSRHLSTFARVKRRRTFRSRFFASEVSSSQAPWAVLSAICGRGIVARDLRPDGAWVTTLLAPVVAAGQGGKTGCGKALFVPARGDSWTPADDKIALLPKGKRSIALAVWNAIVGLLPLGETEVKVTDWRLSKSDWLRGYSLLAVQNGVLPELPNDPESNADGIGLIQNRERRNGRRKIIVRAAIKGW